MINRKITILGPEGTNLYILLQFMLFSVISWFTLFSSIESIEFESSNILTRQIVFSLIGLFVFFLTTYLSIENLYNLINSLFILSISVLLGLLFTTPILGVRRWYDLEPIGLPIFIQPSEFSKIILVLFLARILSQKSYKLIALLGVLVNLLLIEAIILISSIFHHSNINLPTKLEKALSFIIVTPSIHWVHHHKRQSETDAAKLDR